LKAFSTIPFLRICFPFIIGILSGIQLNLPPLPLVVFVLLIIGIAALHFRKQQTWHIKTAMMVLVDVFLLFYGFSLVAANNIRQNEHYYGNFIRYDSAITFIAVANDLPEQKNKFKKCELKVVEILGEKASIPVTGKLLAYIRNSQISKNIEAGTVVVIRGRPVIIPVPSNPFEFNYHAFMGYRQIYYSVFVDSGSVALLPVGSPLNPVWEFGLNCKKKILSRLRNGGLDNNAYSICSALLTGYDDEIDKSVMEAFSHSGTLHVLSVSGLHTGLIYLVLNFLFDQVDRRKRHKLARFFFITICLWSFALLTGFAAPVLRAVIMFNLLGLGRVYFRSNYRNQLNILLVSAFLLLSYNPFFIMDVGFQLSYTALGGLIYFQPKLGELFKPQSAFMASIWQSTTASVAATLSTLPITLFYFKQFPLWFIVCNIVVVPATFLILLLGVLVVFHVPLVAMVTNIIIYYLIEFIGLFNFSGIGFIDHLDFGAGDMLFLSVLIILASASLHHRSYRLASASLVLIIIWQFYSLAESANAKSLNLLTVYNVGKSTALSAKYGQNVKLSMSDTLQYSYHVKPHITSFNYPDVHKIRFNYCSLAAEQLLVLDKPGHWPDIDCNKITTIVLANNFRFLESDIRLFPSLKTLVADASNNSYSLEKLGQLSRKFGFAIYNTRAEGAFLQQLE
jgi:competence protein ComEC